jgi:hypothetical protein
MLIKVLLMLLVTTEKYSFELEDFFQTTVLRGYAVAQLVEALCYKLAGHGFDSPMGPLRFLIGPGVDSASNRNEY